MPVIEVDGLVKCYNGKTVVDGVTFGPKTAIYAERHERSGVSLELSMVGLVVRSMPVSLEFYRRLGVEIPADADSERFVMHRMESGVTLFWDTVFAKKYDPAREEPAGGYRIMLEFFLVDNDAVDAKYDEMVGFGYHGRNAPMQTSGPYAAMVDDPDGNMILLTAG